jgi:hypothetical protein
MRQIAVFFVLLGLISCEKEIDIAVADVQQQYVVEASINQQFPTMNYVFITKTIDYFKPEFSLNGLTDAKVAITEGSIVGNDTFYNGTVFPFNTISDSILPGIYVNPLFKGKLNTPYQLNIELKDGNKISGNTFIGKPPVIDSLVYWSTITSKDTACFFWMQWQDGPEQNNYRMAIYNGFDSILLGWGAAQRFYTFDDQLINNTQRPFRSLRPYAYGDTINIYLSSIGRKEYQFWQSFGTAVNNNGPFASPVVVKSNIKGAIGSFTGYAIEHKKFIIK